jgi:prepilin-type N-terminal cleavage/methylation domain-containing protein
MINLPVSRIPGLAQGASGRAFTLIEPLMVIAIIGILAAILPPAPARAKARAQAVLFLNNTRQLLLAWQVLPLAQSRRTPAIGPATRGPNQAL